jgi:hypothetical protein
MQDESPSQASLKLRFQPGERIIWKVGAVWKSGILKIAARTRQEANAQIPPGYHLDTPKKDAKGPFYYVAEDTPLFQGAGYLHSVRERHMQKESASWAHLEKILLSLKLTNTQLLQFLVSVAKFAHKKRSKTPPEILAILRSLSPLLFPLDEDEPNH